MDDWDLDNGGGHSWGGGSELQSVDAPWSVGKNSWGNAQQWDQQQHYGHRYKASLSTLSSLSPVAMPMDEVEVELGIENEEPWPAIMHTQAWKVNIQQSAYKECNPRTRWIDGGGDDRDDDD